MNKIISMAAMSLTLIGCAMKPPEMSDNAKRYQAIIDNQDVQPSAWRGTVWGKDDDKSIRVCSKLAQLATLADRSNAGRSVPKNQTEYENLVVLFDSGMQLILTPECVGNRTKWRNNYAATFDLLRTAAAEIPADIAAGGEDVVSFYRRGIARGSRAEELAPHHKTIIDLVRVNALGMQVKQQYSTVYIPNIQMPR